MHRDDILDLAREYTRISGDGQMKVMLMVCEWSKVMSMEAIERRLRHMINDHQSVWTLQEGNRSCIIKETGEIIETEYKDNEYFKAVRDMGNLTLTKEEAEELVIERKRP